MNENGSQSNRAPVTMQISVTDRDYHCAKHVIPHQLRTLGASANEVLISVNRYDKPANTGSLNAFLDDLSEEFDNIRLEEVDYSREARQWISDTFFDGNEYPLFDHKGIPIHAFIEPYTKASNPYLFRLECDMLLGGAGPWFLEAIRTLDAHADVIAVNPLAGPRIPGANYHSNGYPFKAVGGEAFKVDLFTTRTHLIEIESFCQSMGSLDQSPPKLMKDRVYSRVAGYPVVNHLEILFQNKMRQGELIRADFGGSGSLWTLHPVYKTPQVLSQLPRLIQMVESRELPDVQSGQYDLHPGVLGETDRPTRRDELKRIFVLARSRISSKRKPEMLRSEYFKQTST